MLRGLLAIGVMSPLVKCSFVPTSVLHIVYPRQERVTLYKLVRAASPRGNRLPPLVADQDGTSFAPTRVAGRTDDLAVEMSVVMPLSKSGPCVRMRRNNSSFEVAYRDYRRRVSRFSPLPSKRY
jgi:hypothetical protein